VTEESSGEIRRVKRNKDAEPAKGPAPAPAATPAAAPAHETKPDGSHDANACPGCIRLRAALRETRKRVRRLIQENRTLREELLSAGEMIEDLASDLERPL
jgi:hypothetical protein